jgi:glycosyltransferase involved in cell wall biosynthesis
MPAYNCERFISQAIQSILDQTFQRFELIVADDRSTDRTREIIDSFYDPRIMRSHNEMNMGKVKTVNRLLELCKGEFITIHDADDFSDPARFEKQINFLTRNPEYALCGTNFYSGILNGPFESIIKMPADYNEIKSNYLIKSQIHGPTMVFKRNILKEVGGLFRSPELFRNKEDVDFICRVVEKFKVTNLQEPLYYYRNLPNSLSKSGYSYLKFEGFKLIRFLAEERRNQVSDSISLGGSKELEFFLANLEKPYLMDKSLLHRKASAHLMYFRFYRQAIIQAMMAILKEPFIPENYRTAQYCIRKYLNRIIKVDHA